MISTYKHNSITWTDLENPTHDEIKKIAEKYGINPTVANDLLNPSSRTILEEHHDYVYLILHFPVTVEKEKYGKTTEIQEVDFILGKDFIITNRYSVVDSLMEFTKSFMVSSVLNKNRNNDHAGYVFYEMVKGLYSEMNNRLDYVNNLLKEAEEGIFKGEEKHMVIELSKLNRLLLHFNKAISIHEEVLKGLIACGEDIYGKDYLMYLRNIFGEYLKVKSTIQNLKDYTCELRGTNDSLLSSKQNETMKFITIVAFVTIPASVMANLFSMNAIATPIIGARYDFWIILGIMSFVAFIMFTYFKIKKWF